MQDILNKKMYHIRVQLDEAFDEEELELLNKNSATKKGISRDLIVPEDITLHALHYAIQRAFGWRNSHLHDYTLDNPFEKETVFGKLVDHSFLNYLKFCGYYFRNVTYDSEEKQNSYYSDDDYTEGENFKIWLRRKYTGPYLNKVFFEHSVVIKNEIRDFIKENPKLRISPSFESQKENGKKSGKDKNKLVPIEELTIEDVKSYFEEQIGALLERLRLDEVLDTGNGKADLDKLNRMVDDNEGVMDAKVKILIIWLALMHSYAENEALIEIIKKSGNPKLIKEAKSHEYDPQMDEIALMPISMAFDESRMEPVADSIYYLYDYGDAWTLKIDFVKSLNVQLDPEPKVFKNREEQTDYEKAQLENASVSDDKGQKLEKGETRDTIVKAAMKHTVHCIDMDGPMLLDDVGGIGGFLDFLRVIYGDDKQAASEMLEWAEGQEWQKKCPKPSSLI